MTSPLLRPLGIASPLVLLLAIGPTGAAGQATKAAIIGSWHGTSTCVDKVAFPACHDEEVIYDVRAVSPSSDSVAVRADKVVNGVRDFMGEFVLGPGSKGQWIGTIQTGRGELRLLLTVEGSRMSGALAEVASGRQARAMALQRVVPKG